MILQNIKAVNFRNYEELDLNLDADKPVNVIISPNGMGKSNLLEMIYYLSYLRSFRNVNDKELINRKQKSFHLECSFLRDSFKNKISVNYDTKKNILLNDKPIRKHSELLGKLLSVLFCSEDIFIINGSPSIRRRFFDIFISILDKKYLDCLRKFQLLLKQKNLILKNERQKDLIGIYNIQLAQVITYIQAKRDEIIGKINDSFQDYYKEIGMFDKKVKIVYVSSIRNNSYENEKNLAILENNKNKELEAGHCLVGPHRDNYLFLLNGISFSKYASFGQTRLAALVLKLVQTIFYKKVFRVSPILLLDDVILELDKEKQKNFLSKIADYDQIFLTVTSREFVELINTDSVINEIVVNNGKIK